MKLKPGADVTEFIHAVRKCRDDVFFETTEGDRLNLKSLLCQYMFAALIGKPELLYRSSISCAPEDLPVLEEYLC